MPQKCNRNPKIGGVTGPAYILTPEGKPKRVTRSWLTHSARDPNTTIVYGTSHPIHPNDFNQNAPGVLQTTIGEYISQRKKFGRKLRKQAAHLKISLDNYYTTEHDRDDIEWSSNDWCLSRDGIIEAADVVVTRDGPEGLEVLCIRRTHPPFASTWALPGGLRDPGETLQETAKRELAEETGLETKSLTRQPWLGEIQATDWDPRAVGVHVGAAHYHANNETTPIANDDAKQVKWVPIASLADGSQALAFGHAQWLALAMADHTEISENLDLIARASRKRNRRLISQINHRCAKAGAPQIEIPTAEGSWIQKQPKDVFDTMATRELEEFALTTKNKKLKTRAIEVLNSKQKLT